MPKRWSKLKSRVEALLLEELDLHIHCSEIRGGWDHKGFVELGTFTVRLGKSVIWDFPKQFVTVWTVYPDGGNHYSYSVSDINGLLREYVDTPRSELPEKVFERDYFGITDILKAADRRISIARLNAHFASLERPHAVPVLESRAALPGQLAQRISRAD